MTKPLQQIQEENRKFILEAIHGCSYEEALKKELGFGCKVLVQHFVYIKESTEIIKLDESVGICDLTGLYVYTNYGQSKIIEIIGKPLTLSRVLLALKSKEDLSNPKKYELYLGITKLFYYNYAKNIELVLDLSKETLEEQTEETQRGLNELFND